MNNQIESFQQPCPLGQVSDFRSNSMRHYAPKSLGGGDADTGLQELKVRHIDAKEPKQIEVDGSVWTYMEQLSVGWQFAPDDPRYTNLDAKRPVTPRHIHASFQVGKHEVHADYVLFMSWGPLMGAEEFLVFIDGVLRCRGGLFACPPGGWPRNWPLAIPLEDQLLLFDRHFDGGPDLSTFTGLSLWNRTMKFYRFRRLSLKTRLGITTAIRPFRWRIGYRSIKR